MGVFDAKEREKEKAKKRAKEKEKRREKEKKRVKEKEKKRVKEKEKKQRLKLPSDTCMRINVKCLAKKCLKNLFS